MPKKDDRGGKKKSDRRRDFDDESDVHEEELVATDGAQEMLDVAVKKTPWWMISVAFHVLVLASLGLITFSRIAKATDEQIIQFVKPDIIARVDVPPRERGYTDMSGLVNVSSQVAEEPPVVDPRCVELSDKNRSNDGEDFDSYKGNETAQGWRGEADPGLGRKTSGVAGMSDVVGAGVGSGTGGRWGHRHGSNRWTRGPGGPTVATEDAVKAGLFWLARHQDPDGHWDPEGFSGRCGSGGACDPQGKDKGLHDFEVGVTGLSLLAFLGAGYTPQIQEREIDPVTKKPIRFGDCVRKGLDWVIKHQNADGCIGPQVGEMMYNHAIAALALSEAYGLTNAVGYRAPAQKAINFIHQAQNYGLGWRYTPKSGQNDTSVTGWCVMALKSAQISGLEVAQTSYEGAKAWVQRVTQDSGVVGYDRLASGEVVVPGKNEQFQSHPSMTAVGMLCRIFIDKRKDDPALAKGAKIVADDLPKWDARAEHPTVDFYYWYYAALALYQYDGPKGQYWSKWNEAMKNTLCHHQHAHDGCLDGSWDTGGVDRWGYAGGRVYGTAMNVLSLEVYYRYKKVFGGDARAN